MGIYFPSFNERSNMDKVKGVLQSRKFWALVVALVAVGCGYFTGAMAPTVAIQTAVAALSAYAIGTGLDNGTPPGAPAQ